MLAALLLQAIIVPAATIKASPMMMNLFCMIDKVLCFSRRSFSYGGFVNNADSKMQWGNRGGKRVGNELGDWEDELDAGPAGWREIHRRERESAEFTQSGLNGFLFLLRKNIYLTAKTHRTRRIHEEGFKRIFFAPFAGDTFTDFASQKR